MESTTAKVATVVVAVVVLAGTFAALRPGSDDATDARRATTASRAAANFEIVAVDGGDGKLRGVAMLDQDGDRVRGYVAVWGLEPGTTHAAHIHGPDAACAPQRRTRRHAVNLPDLVADEHGVAYRRIDLPTEPGEVVTRPGYYLMVHRGAEGHSAGHGGDDRDNPGIACGAVGEPGALTVAEGPSGGDPTSGKRSQPPPTATVRVRDGRPVGDVAEIEVRRGETVRIAFRSDTPGEVHIHGVDEYVDLVADKPVIATFEATAEGVFEIENHDTGELLGKLEVRPR